MILTGTDGESRRYSLLLPLLALAAAAIGFLALASPAFASNVDMEQVWDGNRFLGKVTYKEAFQEPWTYEANDVRVRLDTFDRLDFADRGAYIWAGTGIGQNYGCAGGGDWAVCDHPNGIVRLDVWLDLGGRVEDDRFALDSSQRLLPSTLQVSVHAGRGNDEIDVRGASQRDGVVCGSGFDRAFLDWGDTVSTDCEFKVFDGTLPGQLTSGPAVASWAEGRFDVFYRGTSNELRHKWWGGWGDESLGGVITSDPAAVSWGPGRIDVFARGQDNALWHKWYDGGWSDWESLGGYLTSAPAVASYRPGHLAVFYRGANNDLRYRSYEPLYAAGWSAEQSLGGEISSKPAAVSWGLWRIDVVARGMDGAVYRKWFESGWWSGWERIDGQLAAAPAVASRGSGSLDLFALGTDKVLYRKTFDNGNWSPDWESFRRQLASDPAAISWGSGRVDVFGRAPDDRLAQSTLLP
jgi:hypothetical protein